MLKKLFYIFLIVIFSLTVAAIQAAVVEHNVKATVTINPVEGELRVFPSYFEINAAPLAIVEKNLTFWQENGNIDINVNLSSNLDFISFSENNFILSPTENKTIIAYINTPNVGVYDGEIYVNYSDELVIPVDLIVTDEYDISLDINTDFFVVGDNVSVFTNLSKYSTEEEVEGKIKVNLTYNILRRNKLITTYNIIKEVENYNEFTVNVPMPTNIKFGIYTIEATAVHLDKTTKDSDRFLFIRKLPWKK